MSFEDVSKECHYKSAQHMTDPVSGATVLLVSDGEKVGYLFDVPSPYTANDWPQIELKESIDDFRSRMNLDENVRSMGFFAMELLRRRVYGIPDELPPVTSF